MIKNIIFVTMIVLTIVSCKNKEANTSFKLDNKNMILPQDDYGTVITPKRVYSKGQYPAIEIKDMNFDFGTINQGDKVEHIFAFKNTGKNNLIITNAQASCGCTVPEWTKDEIKPGESGQIKIIFNSAGKSGAVIKTVTLMTNTEVGSEVITFKANILTNNNNK
jgi:hypothetical protein